MATSMTAAQSGDSGSSRRERKKRATRTFIKEIALDLFDAHGFDNVTIMQISGAADVDVTTFWRHFGSKLAILCCDLEDWSHSFRAAVRDVPADVSLLDAAMTALIVAPPISHTSMKAMREQVRTGPPSQETRSAILAIDEVIRSELAAALAERLGDDGALDPRPHILSGAIVGATHWYSTTEKNRDISATVTTEVGAIIRDAVRHTLD